MLALDFILIILTLTCILYCMVLNKRIYQIQKYRSEMMNLFKEFDKSINKAEAILEETKMIIPNAESQIKKINKALNSEEEKLGILIQKSDRLAEELETIIISGNKLFSRLSEVILNGCELVEKTEQNESQKTLDLGDLSDKITLSQVDYYQTLQYKKGQLNEN